MSISITGRNQYGEVVTEVISDEMLHDSFVTGLAIVTREKYASIGIDLDEELREMTSKKSIWIRFKSMCIAILHRAMRFIRVDDGRSESLW